MENIQLWTDGSAEPNPGLGGFGIIIIHNGVEYEFCGGEPHTTNNRMELSAVIIGLSYIKNPSNVTVYSDSEYVVNPYRKNWISKWRKQGFKNRKNSDLWELLEHEVNRHCVEFKHVSAHSGIKYNERADLLASQGARKLM